MAPSVQDHNQRPTKQREAKKKALFLLCCLLVTRRVFLLVTQAQNTGKNEGNWAQRDTSVGTDHIHTQKEDLETARCKNLTVTAAATRRKKRVSVERAREREREKGKLNKENVSPEPKSSRPFFGSVLFCSFFSLATVYCVDIIIKREKESLEKGFVTQKGERRRELHHWRNSE